MELQDKKTLIDSIRAVSFNITDFTRKLFEERIFPAWKENTNKIVNAINNKESTKPQEITDPINSKLNEVKKSIEDKEFPEYPEQIDIRENIDKGTEAIESLGEKLEKLNPKVTINTDLEPIIELLKESKDKTQLLEKLNEIKAKFTNPNDYTSFLKEISSKIKDVDTSKIETILKGVATTDDLIKISQYLDILIEKPNFDLGGYLDKNGRLPVAVDQSGGGGGSKGSYNKDLEQVNPATEDKQDNAITQLTLSVDKLTAILANQTNGDQQIQGNVAHSKIDSGNPVKVGGIYNAIVPPVSDGERSDIQTNEYGTLKTVLYHNDEEQSFGSDSVDAVSESATVNKPKVLSRMTYFDQTDDKWDRVTGDRVNGLKTYNPTLSDGTQTAVTTGIEHQKIHDGDHYQYGDYQQTVSIGDTISFVFETPADVVMHLSESLYSLQGITVDIYEKSSNIVGGTIVSPWNNNRTSAKTTGLVIKKDPTSITVGTRLEGFLSGGNKTSGNNERAREFDLDKSTIYYFLITSLNNSNAVSWDFNWYEDID